MNKRKGSIEIVFAILLIIALIGAFIWAIQIDYGNEQTLEITIKDKYVKTYGENGKYLVVGTNNTTYEIEDLLFKGKFNSTDLYNSLDVGSKYIITTTGYRIQFLSSYQNINSAKKVEN